MLFTYCNCNNCRDIFINLFSDHVFSWNADKYIKILTTPNTQSAPKFIEKKNGIFKYTWIYRKSFDVIEILTNFISLISPNRIMDNNYHYFLLTFLLTKLCLIYVHVYNLHCNIGFAAIIYTRMVLYYLHTDLIISGIIG